MNRWQGTGTYFTVTVLVSLEWCFRMDQHEVVSSQFIGWRGSIDTDTFGAEEDPISTCTTGNCADGYLNNVSAS